MAKKTHAERRAAGDDVLNTLRGGGVDTAAAAAALEARLGAERVDCRRQYRGQKSCRTVAD